MHYQSQPGLAGRRNMAWRSSASRGLRDTSRHETLTFPGPGAYDSHARSSIGFLGEKYTMRLKTALPSRHKTPGPGAYTPKEGMDCVGKYLIAKYPNSGATKLNQAQDKSYSSVNNPGPGAYSPKITMSSTGEYYPACCKNTGSRSFSRAPRAGFPGVKVDTPGPGTYRLMSEFGLYEPVMMTRKGRTLTPSKRSRHISPAH